MRSKTSILPIFVATNNRSYDSYLSVSASVSVSSFVGNSWGTNGKVGEV